MTEHWPRGTLVRINTPKEPRFHDRQSRIVSWNLGEAGLKFGESLVWFAPESLVYVGPPLRSAG